MIKRYDSHLIPTRATLSYPDINYSLPKGSTFATAMRMSAIKTLRHYSYTTYPHELEVHFQPVVDFTSFIKLARPKTRRWRTLGSGLFTFAFDGYLRSPYFRSSDEAYIDMFLNYPSAITKYQDTYDYLYAKYPEYFI